MFKACYNKNMPSNKNIIHTKEKTKKELLAQIFVPIVLFSILFVVLSLLMINVSNGGNQTIQHWANISIIFLIVPMLLSVLLFFALIILIIFGQAKLIKWLPVHTANLYVFVMKIAIFVMNASNKITEPVIGFRSKLFSLKSIYGRKEDKQL